MYLSGEPVVTAQTRRYQSDRRENGHQPEKITAADLELQVAYHSHQAQPRSMPAVHSRNGNSHWRGVAR